ncbi:MAG: hypothetical protein KAY32_15480 [Candidatus Eisenbacteria sp.]|nr:hypothetical protein [Candidatus Eisenbacteria bacterium]
MKDNPKVKKYDVTPYAARAFILNLEIEYDLTIRVHEGNHYSVIYIDKEEKKDDTTPISQGPTASRY